MGLEYLDEFLIVDHTASWIDDLFSNETMYLALHTLNCNEFWHSHTGFFTHTDIDNSKMLTKINLDYIKDSSDRYKVTSQIQHQIRLEKQFNFTSFKEKQIEVTFSTMHDFNKKVLADLLTSQMAGAINLEK